MGQLEEITLVCKDCNNQFIFEIGEQEFYNLRGWINPIRCRDCRLKKKAYHEQIGRTNKENRILDNKIEAFRNEYRRKTT